MNPPENQREVEVSEEVLAAAKRAAAHLSPICDVCSVAYVDEYRGPCQEPLPPYDDPSKTCRGKVDLTPEYIAEEALQAAAPVLCAQERERLGMVECPNCGRELKAHGAFLRDLASRLSPENRGRSFTLYVCPEPGCQRWSHRRWMNGRADEACAHANHPEAEPVQVAPVSPENSSGLEELDQLERWMVDYDGEEGGPVETKLSWITGPDGDPTTKRPDVGEYLIRLSDAKAALTTTRLSEGTGEALANGELDNVLKALRVYAEAFPEPNLDSARTKLEALRDGCAPRLSRGGEEGLRERLLSDAAVHALYCHAPDLDGDDDAGPDEFEEAAIREALSAVADAVLATTQKPQDEEKR